MYDAIHLSVLAAMLTSGAQQLAKVVPDTPGNLAFFGTSVAFDGERALVGAQGDGFAGSAYFFDRQGQQWVQRQRLVPTGLSHGAGFGRTVALHGDRLAVGAPWHDGGDQDTGTVYVYREVAGVWELEARLATPLPGHDDRFGIALALDDTALVAATPFRDDLATDAGAAYVFRRSGTSWAREATLYAEGAVVQTLMGVAVDVRDDRIVVGAVDAGIGAGAAFVFEKSGSTWTQSAKLVGTDASERFGNAVSLFEDGLMAGAPGHHSTGEAAGSAYVFRLAGTSWVQAAELVPSSARAFEFHGTSVATDGTTFVVGSPLAFVGPVRMGGAFVFREYGGTWVERAQLLGSDTIQDDHFGEALSVFGERILVSAVYHDAGGLNSGSAYEFLVAEPPVAYCTAKTNSLGCVPSISGAGEPSASQSTGFVVSVANVQNQKTGQFFYGLSGRLAAPFHGGTLCVATPIKRTPGVVSGGAPKPTNDCSGVYGIDFNAFTHGPGAPFTPAPELQVPGTKVWIQCWGRDQGFSPPLNHGLSDALEFTIGL